MGTARLKCLFLLAALCGFTAIRAQTNPYIASAVIDETANQKTIVATLAATGTTGSCLTDIRLNGASSSPFSQPTAATCQVSGTTMTIVVPSSDADAFAAFKPGISLCLSIH